MSMDIDVHLPTDCVLFSWASNVFFCNCCIGRCFLHELPVVCIAMVGVVFLQLEPVCFFDGNGVFCDSCCVLRQSAVSFFKGWVAAAASAAVNLTNKIE